MMMIKCEDCGASIQIPEDAQNDEILSCVDCGLDYLIEYDDTGTILFKVLTIEGEDWGE